MSFAPAVAVTRTIGEVDTVAQIRAEQAGVVSRAQLLASGLVANDVRRLLRRRELVRVHAGEYAQARRSGSR